jgi:dienelactone hydrolase
MIQEALFVTRWQFVIAYVVAIFIFISIYFHHYHNLILKRVLIGIYTFMIVLFIASLYVFPMTDIPNPSGDYQIGTYVETVEDMSREEEYTSGFSYRKFTYQMWYPVDDIGEGKVMPWLSGGKDIARGLTKSIGLPSFILDHIQHTESNSYQIQTISDDQDSYPVVLISHGWGGFMNLHTDLAEELASRGYIVISIDHTYGSVATKLDSQTVYQYKDALPPRDETPNFLTYANQLVYTYAGDVSFMLDYIEIINNDDDSFLYNKLDLESIGLIGHSTGGGADVGVALDDNRIDALIGLDAWVEPILMADIENGLTMPSLFLRSETWEEGENNTNLLALIESSSDATLYQIDGTTHADYSMAYMFSPLMSMIGYTGSLDTDYLVDMQKAMINYFFDLHLKDDEDATFNFNHWDEVHEVSSS